MAYSSETGGLPFYARGGERGRHDYGEKKLRENLGELYGAVNGYSGRPTQSQIESTTVLLKKLDESGAQFQSIATSQVPPLNTALQGKQLEPLKATSREDWDKKQNKRAGRYGKGTHRHGDLES
jgi:hypothetical protein